MAESCGPEKIGTALSDAADLETSEVRTTRQDVPPSAANNELIRTKWRMSRRSFQIGLGIAVTAVLVIGIALGVSLGAVGMQPASPRRSLEYKTYSSCSSAVDDIKQGLEDSWSDTQVTVVDVSNDPNQYFHHNEQGFYGSQAPDFCSYCNCSGQAYFSGVQHGAVMEGTVMEAQVSAAASDTGIQNGKSAGSSTSDFSGTNNQVDSVDEGDIVKTDGKYIYVLPAYEFQLVIARVYPFDQASQVSHTDLRPYRIQPKELLLDGDLLVIVGTTWGILSDSASPPTKISSDRPHISVAVMQVWNITNRTAPSIVKQIEVEGDAITSRLVSCNTAKLQGMSSDGCNVAYLVVQTSWLRTYQYHNRISSMNVQFRPPLWRKLSREQARTDEARKVSMENMCNCTLITKVEGLESPPTGFLSVIALRLSGDRMGEVSASTHAGRGHNIMMSETNVYIAETNWNYMSSSIPGVLPSGGVWTAMLKFAMNGGSPQFSKLITIPGSVLNQFSMDEHRDHLRVATTYGEMWSNPPTSVSGVYIFNANGEQTGEVTELAPGERIYSARFEGDKAYVVTFRQVDPLFVLDLRDPTAPIVQGQLKIPGFSNYLHPVNFTHLLGLGHDADLEGRTGGVKISLFNVRDPTNPKEAQSIVIGGKGSSTIAAYDHKSFLFYSKNGLLAFPIEERENYEKKYDGCLLYNITVAGYWLHATLYPSNRILSSIVETISLSLSIRHGA